MGEGKIDWDCIPARTVRLETTKARYAITVSSRPTIGLLPGFPRVGVDLAIEFSPLLDWDIWIWFMHIFNGSGGRIPYPGGFHEDSTLDR